MSIQHQDSAQPVHSIAFDKSAIKYSIFFFLSLQENIYYGYCASPSVWQEGYQVNIFFKSPWKHTLWILIRNVSPYGSVET